MPLVGEPLGEESHGCRGTQVLHRPLRISGHERLEHDHAFTDDGQRYPRRDDDAQARTARQQRRRQARGGAQHPLGLVGEDRGC